MHVKSCKLIDWKQKFSLNEISFLNFEDLRIQEWF